MASHDAIEIEEKGRCRASRIANHPFELALFSNGTSERTLVGVFENLDTGAKIYMQSMEEFEQSMFSTYGDNDLLLREAVGLDLGPNPKPLSPNQTRQHYILCKTISAYRLIEELGYLSDVSPTLAAPRLSRRMSHVSIETMNVKHIDKLNDISSLVNDFCEKFKEMSNFRLTGHAEPGPLAHLRTLFQLNKANTFVKIFTNVTVAALHLGYVLDNQFHGDLPDLPDAPDDYLSSLDSSSGNSTTLQNIPEEVAFLKTLYFGATEKDKPNLRSTLQAVLMISPLVILVPVELHKKKWNRKNMLQLAAFLGNSRPPQLVRVERLIFRTIYDVARRATDISTAVFQLSNALSDIVKNGELLADDIRYWFRSTPHISTAIINEGDNSNFEVVIAQTGTTNAITTEIDVEDTITNSIITMSVNPHDEQNDDGEDEIIEDDTENYTTLDAPRKNTSLDSLTSGGELRKRKRASNGMEESDGKPRKSHPKSLKDSKRVVSSKATHPAKRRKAVNGQTILSTPSEDEPTSKDVHREVIIIDYDTEVEADEGSEAEENSLQLFPIPSKQSSKTKYNIYGPTENSLTSFSPISHHNADLCWQEEFLQTVHDSYVDGKPLHLVNPNKSAFLCLTAAEFENKSVYEIQEFFSHQNIVVYDLPEKHFMEFNEAGFYKLVASLDEKIDVQDQSISPTDGNYNDRVKRGTVRQILDAHREDGKILNALNFPGTHLTHPYLSLSSDLAAWDATRSRKMSQNEDYPTRDMRWFLAATKGATHMWHIDSDGAGTFISAENGSKLWIVAHKKDDDNEESFASINFFLPPFDITKICNDKWTLEAIVLKPGSCLYMRPNTPHAVITMDSAICHGGHLYSISTMQATAASLMHTFVTGSLTTNTNHDPTRVILRRMAELCYLILVRNKLHDNPRALAHVPSLDSVDGVFNLLSLCNLVIFANVLDRRTYLGWQQDSNFDHKRTKQQNCDIRSFDRNALSLEDREKYRHARGMCLQIMLWFAASFEVTTKGSSGEINHIDDVLDDLVFAYLVQQGRALLAYKRKADRHKISGFIGCTLHELNVQLDAVFALDHKLKKNWDSSANDPETKYNNLLWSGRKDLIFKKKHAKSLSEEFKVVDFSASGTTSLDSIFFSGYTTNFKET